MSVIGIVRAVLPPQPAPFNFFLRHGRVGPWFEICPITTESTRGQVDTLVVALAVIPCKIEAYRTAMQAINKIWIVLYMNEDIIGAIVWSDKAIPPLKKELGDRAPARPR